MIDLLNHPVAGPFWRGAAQDKLLMCHCLGCSMDVWYPQASCPVCSATTEWRELTGQASLLSWTVVRRQVNDLLAVPYVSALVRPDDAPTTQLIALLRCEDTSKLRCDMPVRVVFTDITPLSGASYRAPVFIPGNH